MKARFFVIALAVFSLSGCATSAIEFYDQCAQKTASFIEMTKCGKTSSDDFCQSTKLCSADDTSVMLYADSLAASVKSKELSEPAAQRKWIEYRDNHINNARQQALLYQAAQPKSVTCYGSGNYTHCY